MLLSKCGICERAIRADAMWCPRCGAFTSAGARYGKINVWPWLVVVTVCCAFLTIVGLTNP